MEDKINHPKHYCSHPSGVECIQVTEHMNFNLGNVVKYCWRTDHKNGLEDLKKARWYLEREITRLEVQNQAKTETPTPPFFPELTLNSDYVHQILSEEGKKSLSKEEIAKLYRQEAKPQQSPHNFGDDQFPIPNFDKKV